MANNILYHKGNQIGKSIKEEDCGLIIDEIFETSKKYPCTIVYPEDVLVGKNLNDKSQIKEINEIADFNVKMHLESKGTKIRKSSLAACRRLPGWWPAAGRAATGSLLGGRLLPAAGRAAGGGRRPARRPGGQAQLAWQPSI